MTTLLAARVVEHQAHIFRKFWRGYAVKFTPEGGRIAVRAGLANGAAEISVTDTGIGIAPEDQDAVFEEFRQVGKAERKAEGTGLGLALCRKFVELHGGQIWVKSQVDVGSTFTFTIPLT